MCVYMMSCTRAPQHVAPYYTAEEVSTAEGMGKFADTTNTSFVLAVLYCIDTPPATHLFGYVMGAQWTARLARAGPLRIQ